MEENKQQGGNRMNEQNHFRTTNHGPRATNGPDDSIRSDNAKHSRQEEWVRKNNSSPENASLKTENLRNFRDLKVWQAAKEIAVVIYKVTQRFPQEEIYGLSSQMRRAAISVSSNIAEGFNRFYRKDYQRFLMIALGSCGELESQLEVGAALGYVPKEVLVTLLEKLNHENRMLRKLHSKLREDQKSRGEHSTGHVLASSASESVPLQY